MPRSKHLRCCICEDEGAVVSKGVELRQKRSVPLVHTGGIRSHSSVMEVSSDGNGDACLRDGVRPDFERT